MTESKFTPPGFVSLFNVITGTGEAAALNDCRDVSWNATYPGTAPTSGTAVVEEAPSKNYAGTWKTIATVALNTLSTGAGGAGREPGQHNFVRWRITVAPDQPVNLYLNGLLH